MIQRKGTITILVLLIILLSLFATLLGITSKEGPGPFQYESIRGKSVEIYGKGIYKHMSADVAVQGIAQDYITLFLGIPMLIISLLRYQKKSIRGYFLLCGTLGYFFVTYLFYTAMGMYNIMFLGYAALMGLSFFGLIILLTSFDISVITEYFSEETPNKFVGSFLIFNSIAIALLWLSVVVPPLIRGSIYPEDLEHYTTLIVQGFDLGLLLPLAFISGLFLIKKTPIGYLSGSTYIVFLSILMTALTAKIIAMSINGVNVIPVIFIIPSLNIISIFSSYFMLKDVKKL